MVHNLNRNQGYIKQSSLKRVVSRLATLLCAGFFSIVSTQVYSHPHKSNNDPATDGLKEMKNKYEQMRKRTEEQRIKAQERSSALRKEAKERRVLRKQESIKRREEAEEKKAKHLTFKTKLLSMLLNDNVIISKKDAVTITYSDGDPIANGINLTAQFGDKYKALWSNHNRTISEQSYLNIMLGSYEIREVTKDGGSHHFVTQIN